MRAPEQMQMTLMLADPHSVAITRVSPSTVALAAVMPAKLASLLLDSAAVSSRIVPSDWHWNICFAAVLDVRNCEPMIFPIGAINCSLSRHVGRMPGYGSGDVSGGGEYDSYFVF